MGVSLESVHLAPVTHHYRLTKLSIFYLSCWERRKGGKEGGRKAYLWGALGTEMFRILSKKKWNFFLGQVYFWVCILMNEMSILGVQANLIRFSECQGSCSPPFKQSHYLYSKVNQLYEYTYPLLFGYPFIEVTTEHWVEFLVLYSAFSLVIYFVTSMNINSVLKKEMATYSRILAWEISRTEDPGRLDSTELQNSRTWLRHETTTIAINSVLCVNLNLPIHPTPTFPPWYPYICSLYLCLYFCFTKITVPT